MTTSLLTEAVEKLTRNNPQYVRDAVIHSSDTFESMSDNGSDSLYAAPARRWRWLGADLEKVWNNGDDPDEHFDEDDYEMIAAGLLWYELNTSE